MRSSGHSVADAKVEPSVLWQANRSQPPDDKKHSREVRKSPRRLIWACNGAATQENDLQEAPCVQ